MHRYWAAHRPEDYERLGLSQDWLETFRDEVMWATGQAADMVERLGGLRRREPWFPAVDRLQHGAAGDHG